jgi:hypothetical protein
MSHVWAVPASLYRKDFGKRKASMLLPGRPEHCT